MNIVLWILQILLAFLFFVHGLAMLRTTDTPPQPTMTYILAIPIPLRRFIGAAEILASIGLVLPALTGIVPWLTPLAALGLVILMIGAVVFHFLRKDYPSIVVNLVLLVMAAFVAYGRFTGIS